MADNVNDIEIDTDTNNDDIQVIKINKVPGQIFRETTHEESVLLLKQRKKYVRDLDLNPDSDSTCSTGKGSTSKIPPYHKNLPINIWSPIHLPGPTESDSESIAQLKIKRNELLLSSDSESILSSEIKSNKSSKPTTTIEPGYESDPISDPSSDSESDVSVECLTEYPDNNTTSESGQPTISINTTAKDVKHLFSYIDEMYHSLYHPWSSPLLFPFDAPTKAQDLTKYSDKRYRRLSDFEFGNKRRYIQLLKSNYPTDGGF